MKKNTSFFNNEYFIKYKIYIKCNSSFFILTLKTGWIDEFSFKHRGNAVQCSGFSYDKSLLAVGFDRDVVIKDANSFEDITTLNHNGVVKLVCMS